MIIASTWYIQCDICDVNDTSNLMTNRISEVKESFKKEGWTFDGNNCRCPDCRGMQIPKQDTEALKKKADDALMQLIKPREWSD